MCDVESSFGAHLIEARSRLLRCIYVTSIIFISLFIFSNQIYYDLALPLLHSLTPGGKLIATSVVSPVFVPLKLCLYLSVMISIPFLLYQVWCFIAPGLFAHEKKLIWPSLTASVFLFYLGMSFCYFIVFPLIFKFFASSTPESVLFMPDMSHYLDFTFRLLIAFGVTFEVPMVTFTLISTGILSHEQVAKSRPYVIVLAFTLGMLLTPPDVLSQILLAVPIWFLFEAGILVSKLSLRYGQPVHEISSECE